MKSFDEFNDDTLNEGVSSKVLNSYLETGLWSSSEEELGDKSIRDIDKSVVNQAKKDLSKFFKLSAKLIKGKGYSDTRIAHDFWLTRNGHGAGFWDGDYDDVGDDLTDVADKFSTVELYVGDDGKVYQ